MLVGRAGARAGEVGGSRARGRAGARARGCGRAGCEGAWMRARPQGAQRAHLALDLHGLAFLRRPLQAELLLTLCEIAHLRALGFLGVEVALLALARRRLAAQLRRLGRDGAVGRGRGCSRRGRRCFRRIRSSSRHRRHSGRRRLNGEPSRASRRAALPAEAAVGARAAALLRPADTLAGWRRCIDHMLV